MARVAIILSGLAVLFLALELQVHADTSAGDPTTNYVMETQVAGGPDRAHCLSQNCLYKLLTCPENCRRRETIAPGKSACFLNCLKCEATCKHRKLDCFGYGAVCYDPRFIGGDGVMFYFHGQKDKNFCIVSDRNLHINAHFIGKRPEGRHRDYTWVQGLGIMFDSHKLSIAAKKVGVWDDDVDQLTFSYDGADIDIPELDGAIWVSADRQVVIERTSETNSAHVMIHELMEVSLDVVPITDADSRVHNYQVTDEDRFAHLQMQFNFFGLSPSAHGVLGQTYRPNFKTTVKTDVPMPILGGDEKYLTSSLLSADCMVSQFSVDGDVDSAVAASSVMQSPVVCSSKNGGMSCRR